MAHRRRFVGTRRRSPKVWTCTNDGNVCIPSEALLDVPGGGAWGLTALFAFGPNQNSQDLTILRTRGQWNVSVQGIDFGEVLVVALGMGVITAEAAAAGQSAVPGPGDAADWDGWYFHDTMIVVGSDPAVTAPEPVFQQRTVDAKAMRKIKDGDVFFFAFQAYTKSAGVGVIANAGLFARTLLMSPS